MKSILTALAVFVLTAATAFGQVPQSGHVFLVLEENHSYDKIIGSSSMPYLNSLANQYGLAINYYGNTHPSIGNYFMLTTGQIITNSDGYTSTVTANNIVRSMLTAGVSWKSYAESLPYAGYIGGDSYPYVKHHNPFAYFSDVRNSSSEKLNLVPFSQFKTDMANNALPRFSYIVPNMHHNMHDCPDGMSSCTDTQKKTAADNWLKTNIAPILASAMFQKDGVLIITWDEGNSTDTAHGGGKIATVVISPKVKKSYKATGFYQHQHLLKTMLALLGISSNVPGGASTVTPLAEMFGTTSTSPSPGSPCTLNATSPSVTICTPTANATVSTSVSVLAGTTSATTVSTMQIWLDGVKVYEVYANKLSTTVPMTTGQHRLTVQAKNAAGETFKQTVYVTAQ